MAKSLLHITRRLQGGVKRKEGATQQGESTPFNTLRLQAKRVHGDCLHRHPHALQRPSSQHACGKLRGTKRTPTALQLPSKLGVSAVLGSIALH